MEDLQHGLYSVRYIFSLTLVILSLFRTLWSATTFAAVLYKYYSFNFVFKDQQYSLFGVKHTVYNTFFLYHIYIY